MKTQIENLYLYIGKKIEQSDTKVSSLDKQVSANQLLLKEQVKTQKSIEKDIQSLKKDIVDLKKQITINKQQIEHQIQTQEEIIIDMIKKFNDKFLADKTRMDTDIEQLKNEQDVLKISFTVNEKKLLEKIKSEVTQDIRDAVKGKEYEVLMKYWIQELKNIVGDFEKLKKLHPKEFNLQLNQIVETIEVFKQKLK
ncbi:MAG: hypothetical protein ACFFBP_08570 [Promethearchaeota archaeon]